MNRAFADGHILTPPPFGEGLSAWSCGDARAARSDMAGCRLVAGDPRFGQCLEITRSGAVQRLRHRGETPVLRGRYLRITARLRGVAGPMPVARIAAWPGDARSGHVPGLTEAGPPVEVPEGGETVEASAVLGCGARIGVDMAWGLGAAYAHVGLDLSGPAGGVVRVASLDVEDVSHLFLHSLPGWVDVRDFGAAGDGVTDDRAAFRAADTAARGCGVLVPEGLYRLSGSFEVRARVRVEGQVAMAEGDVLSLGPVLRLEDYARAFGGALPGLRRAVQALMSGDDVRTLDLCGMRVVLDGPLDLGGGSAMTVPERAREIRNGCVVCRPGAGWSGGFALDATGGPELSNLTLRNIEVDGGGVAGGLRFGGTGWTLADCTFAGAEVGAEVSGSGHRINGCRWQGSAGLRIQGRRAAVVVSGNRFEATGIAWVEGAGEQGAFAGLAVTGNLFAGGAGPFIEVGGEIASDGLALAGNSVPAGAEVVAVVPPGSGG